MSLADSPMTPSRPAHDIERAKHDLGDQGPTTENGVARDPDGGAVAWFTDSEGNILVINQLAPGMALPG